MRLGHIVFPKQVPVEVGIFIARFLVFIKTKRLMVSDRERGLWRNIRLVELRSPVPMIDLNQGVHRIMKETGQDDFFRHTRLHRPVSALKNVIRSLLHSQFEEIQECLLGRHLLELLDLSARLSRQEKIANSSTVASCLNLRLNIGSLRKFLR